MGGHWGKLALPAGEHVLKTEHTAGRCMYLLMSVSDGSAATDQLRLRPPPPGSGGSKGLSEGQGVGGGD